jgi:hypothetical protein
LGISEFVIPPPACPYAALTYSCDITMASKENQTLQIFIISLVILVILLAAGLIWVNSNRKAAVASAAQAKEEADRWRRTGGDAQSEANTYKTWMGFAEADTKGTIEKTFTEDMERFGATFEESSRFYRTILENLHEENSKLAKSEIDAKLQVKDFKERLTATEGQKNAQIEEINKLLKQEATNNASERTKFENQDTRISAEKDKIASQLAEQRDRYDDMVAKHATTLKQLNDRMVNLKKFNELLESERPDPDPFAQPEDGLVRWVNQRNKTVWINLGEVDHLRPQVTFSVFSGQEDDALAAERKASIEVTRILSAKMAEARITNDESTNPIVEGDKIYSQVWSPGRQLGFAITGIIDMDGDGREDIARLKSVIALNNGKVDAAPGSDGKMTVDTRYLILGGYPEGRQQEERRRDFDVKSEQADTLGIEPISLTDFLRLMGWQSEQRTVKLGIGAEGKDFPAKKEEVADPRKNRGTDIFRPRKPQPIH